MKIMNLITEYIEMELLEKIREDQWKYKIGNERDLESSIYYYLRKFLEDMQELPDVSLDQKENLQVKSYKISANYTIKGTDIWKLKKGKWVKSKFIMPDILISKMPKSRKALDHKIAFELKSRSPGMTHSPNFEPEAYQQDFRKLNRLVKKRRIQQGYYFLVYSDPEITEYNMQKKIKESTFYSGKNRNRTEEKLFKILLINRNVDPKTRKIISSSSATKRQERQQRQFRTYGDNIDPRFKSNKPKNSTSGSGQKKAWITIKKHAKKASWRRKFPNHPATKQWKRKH
jgi:hypothetical protein